MSRNHALFNPSGTWHHLFNDKVDTSTKYLSIYLDTTYLISMEKSLPNGTNSCKTRYRWIRTTATKYMVKLVSCSSFICHNSSLFQKARLIHFDHTLFTSSGATQGGFTSIIAVSFFNIWFWHFYNIAYHHSLFYRHLHVCLGSFGNCILVVVVAPSNTCT